MIVSSLLCQVYVVLHVISVFISYFVYVLEVLLGDEKDTAVLVKETAAPAHHPEVAETIQQQPQPQSTPPSAVRAAVVGEFTPHTLLPPSPIPTTPPSIQLLWSPTTVFSPPPAVTPSLEFIVLAEAEVEAAETEYAAVAEASDAEVKAAIIGIGEAEAIEASSDPSLQEYYMNRERDIRDSLADKTAQREVMANYLEQIFSSPGRNATTFVETVIYSPGDRPYLYSPHWSVVYSKEHQDIILKEALIRIECWNSHYQT